MLSVVRTYTVAVYYREPGHELRFGARPAPFELTLEVGAASLSEAKERARTRFADLERESGSERFGEIEKVEVLNAYVDPAIGAAIGEMLKAAEQYERQAGPLKAILVLRKALELSPQDPLIHWALMRLYGTVGMMRECNEHLFWLAENQGQDEYLGN